MHSLQVARSLLSIIAQLFLWVGRALSHFDGNEYSVFCLATVLWGVIHKPRGQIFGYFDPLLLFVVTFF